MEVLVEAVCSSVEDCIAAEQSGADRIELCSALSVGGLTPSVGLVQEAIAAVRIPIVAMVRPRAAGFCYSESEFRVMLRDADAFMTEGANGVVFGVLGPDSEIDLVRTRTLAGFGQSVFHRAFDAVSSPFDSLELLIDCGVTRVLTSGGAATAIDGATTLFTLNQRARGRIEIIAAGGIRAANVAEVVEKARVSQVHLGPLTWRQDESGGSYKGPYYLLDGKEIQAVRIEIDRQSDLLWPAG